MALAWGFFGFLTGDDVEILQTGLRRVLGIPYTPWEIRNTLLPNLLVWPMGVAGRVLGVADTRLVCWLAVLPFAVLSTANIVLLYRLAWKMVGDRPVAIVASLLLGTHWLALGFGSTVYPRTASTTCVLLAALFAAQGGRDLARPFLAGSFLGLAFATRYSEAIFMPPTWALLLEAHGPRGWKFRTAALLSGLGLGSALFVGAADSIEWGTPFSSLTAFYEYTIVNRDASALVKNQPFYWYLWRTLRWVPPAALGAIAFLPRARPRVALVFFVLFPVAALSVIHHKDLRYLQGVIPFLCLLGGIALARMWRAGWRKGAVALVAVTLVWSVSNLRFLGKKSMAAVLAAEHLAAKPGTRTVVAQQAWALGDHLVLGSNIAVRDLDLHASPETLGELALGADAIVLYEEWRTPATDQVLREASFCFDRMFRWGRSRPVSVFLPCKNASVRPPQSEDRARDAPRSTGRS